MHPVASNISIIAHHAIGSGILLPAWALPPTLIIVSNTHIAMDTASGRSSDNHLTKGGNSAMPMQRAVKARYKSCIVMMVTMMDPASVLTCPAWTFIIWRKI